MANKTEKMTNVKALDIVLDTCKDMLSEEVLDKLEAIRKSYDSKSASKSKAQMEGQAERDRIKSAILSNLEPGKWYTITEVIKAVPSLETEERGRVAYVLARAKSEGFMEQNTKGGKSMYRLPEAGEELAEEDAILD